MVRPLKLYAALSAMISRRIAGTRWLICHQDAAEQACLLSVSLSSLFIAHIEGALTLCVCVCCTGVVFMAGKVYAVGGFNGSLRVRTVDVYDGMRDQWSSIPSMQERRSTLGAAVLGDLLYAVGGFDGSTGTV